MKDMYEYDRRQVLLLLLLLIHIVRTGRNESNTLMLRMQI